MLSFTHEQNILCSQTQLDDIVHEQTIICRQLSAGHMVGSRPVKRKNNLHRTLIITILNAHKQGLSQAAPLRQSRPAIRIVPLKNGQGDNLSPSKFRKKTRKEAHAKRFISVQKLQAETERGKYILSHL